MMFINLNYFTKDLTPVLINQFYLIFNVFLIIIYLILFIRHYFDFINLKPIKFIRLNYFI